ncbi:hypothetical protein C1646_749788 [Rhizophagus diaphanus]|nr:hypothetical protein C1646_749788 [Rhizophagus diaphanus] [Rhizophagus sp. MUCL 43196]
MLVKDVLFLILEVLKDDRKSLHSCLFVNKTWCEIIVPILWKIPGKYTLTNNAKNSLFNVILLHLSEESRNILKNHGINVFIEEYRRPLFNYISYWRYLNLFLLESMIVSIKNIEKYNISIIRKEVFINKNTKYIYLDIPEQFSYQLHQIPGLARISKTIKKLKFYIMQCNNNDNSGIIKLIEAQKKLVDVHLVYFYTNMRNEPYCKTLEESLIKNSDTIQYLRIGWKPTTNILTSLVNLISLDINLNLLGNTNWNHLGKASLPLLKYLRAQQVPSKILTNLIENTKGHLIEISILYEGTDNRELIRAIYYNCQNLKYLKLSFNNNNISELENLLIKCQYLNGLIIFTDEINEPDWDDLFEILTKSSPISLYKFKLSFIWSFKLLESLKLFFEGWENRQPMLLHTIPIDKYYTNIKQPLQQLQQQMENLIRKYEARGIIKKYDTDLYESIFEEFEWIQKKLLFV